MTSVSFRQGEVRLNFVRSGNKVVAIVDRGETRLYGLPYMGGLECNPRLRSGRFTSKVLPLSITNSEPSEDTREGASSFGVRDAFGRFGTVVTWLILPVVICLSQRLSHACLSINKFVL